MSYSARACQSLKTAEPISVNHPWSIVFLLAQAVVFALLAVSVAIESLPNER